MIPDSIQKEIDKERIDKERLEAWATWLRDQPAATIGEIEEFIKLAHLGFEARQRINKLEALLPFFEKEIEAWEELLIKAHKDCPYSNPKEAEREHKNTMNLLGVIKTKISKIAKKELSKGCDRGCKDAGDHWHDDQPAMEKK